MTRCSVSATHAATDEFAEADLDPIYIKRARELFSDIPLTSDGYVCAPCVQWLNDRRAELV